MYAHSAVEPPSTQALPPVPAGGVESQPGVPGTEYGAYGAVQPNIVANGMSVCSLWDQLQHCKQPQLLISRFTEAASLPYNGHYMIPSAYAAPRGPTADIPTSTQFDQNLYAHDADDPRGTQALPLYFTGGAEFQLGPPGGVGPSAAMSYYDPAMSQAPIDNWTTHHHGTNGYDGAAGPSNGTW